MLQVLLFRAAARERLQPQLHRWFRRCRHVGMERWARGCSVPAPTPLIATCSGMAAGFTGSVKTGAVQQLQQTQTSGLLQRLPIAICSLHSLPWPTLRYAPFSPLGCFCCMLCWVAEGQEHLCDHMHQRLAAGQVALHQPHCLVGGGV